MENLSQNETGIGIPYFNKMISFNLKNLNSLRDFGNSYKRRISNKIIIMIAPTDK